MNKYGTVATFRKTRKNTIPEVLGRNKSTQPESQANSNMSLRDPDDNVYLHSHVSKSDSDDALDMCPSPKKTKLQCDISDMSLSDSDEEYHMYSYDGKFHSDDDWPGPTETEANQDDDGTIEATATTEKEQTSALPFSNMLAKWYKHQ